MFIATHVRTVNDVNGNPRRGWLVYHVSVRGQDTYLGFVPYADEPNWSVLYKNLPGIKSLGDLTVTPGQFRDLMRQRESVHAMRRVADAINGS